METQDVVACAGSGKTTLLAAKLGILARKWPFSHRGIAVLSHTNAAREVVESKLAAAEAHSLTSYPHFVGTIQSFVDQFLAIPACVQYFGHRPTPDDDRLCRNLQGIYGRRQAELGAAANHVRQRCRKDPLYKERFFRKLQYQYKDGELWLPIVRKSKGGRAYYKTSSDTYQQFCDIKLDGQNDGIWGYRDMFALAAKYIADCTRVAELVRWRFPLVFLDEMQDTSAVQWGLLDSLFGNEVVVQRLGDPNQQILADDEDFDDDTSGTAFPRDGHLTLPYSLRLSCSIAKLAQSVAVRQANLIGCSSRRDDLPHTVFMFDRSSVSCVLEEYARLVLRSFSDEVLRVSENRVAAVGAVQRRRSNDSEFPYSLCDYWGWYEPKTEGPAERLACLGDYVLAGEDEMLADGDCEHVLRRMMEGIAELLRRNDTPHPLTGKRFTPAFLTDFLRETQRIEFEEMKEGMYRRCRVAGRIPSVNVGKLGDWARRALSSLTNGKWNSAALAFLAGEPSSKAGHKASAGASPRAQNVYELTENGRQVSVTVGTTHSEKGKTHLATLVMQTHCFEHDLPAVMPWILDRPGRVPKGRTAMHIRRAHVAMTRPKELLCLAVCKDTLPSGFDASGLQKRGWRVTDLTSGQAESRA
jgi:hypothetical protein